jgi:uncharacterized protein
VIPGSRRALISVIGVGVAAGLLAGFFGVGGGIIMVPLMVALLHYDQHSAHATSLAAMFLLATSGAVTFALSGEIDWLVAITIGAGSLVGSTLGAQVMHRISAPTLRAVFAGILVIAGTRMLLGGGAILAGTGLEGAVAGLAGVVIGAVAGFAGGVAGVGGGIIMVPAMVLFLATPQHTAEGTSLLAILFTAAAATRVNLNNRRVELRSALLMGLSGAVAAPVGARLALAIEGDQLRRLFGAFVVYTAVHMSWRLLRSKPAVAD